MANILGQIQHLVRYANWAYLNDDGTEFRAAAADLHGDASYRKLEIETPFFKHHLQAFTPNTHVHLGIRNRDTLVLAFRGTDFPFTVENFVNPMQWWGFWGNTQWPDANVTCVTLGSPRVGNEALVDEFVAHNIVCYRLVVDNDPIPTVPDRFSQAVPGKLPASQPGSSAADSKYQHVGTPVLLHLHQGRDASSDGSSVEIGMERADIDDEEDAAAALPWQINLPYQLGGFVPYWALRGAKMVPRIVKCHDPAEYSRIVQRVLERAAGEMNHTDPLRGRRANAGCSNHRKFEFVKPGIDPCRYGANPKEGQGSRVLHH
ncbi:hypothetical protein BT67DRAFT_381521 [Trichocladium antarcticum]|uniref:Fungal lipase-type domain-containing protein n=1 Tax=Trichocladium antarcticum TaxID=1450529 RepID=A0AAN6UIV7_9PEZI|nr:hypothetical protein BT67DRAFT_381521 [Trichocladium antarcticum]